MIVRDAGKTREEDREWLSSKRQKLKNGRGRNRRERERERERGRYKESFFSADGGRSRNYESSRNFKVQ